MAGAHGRGLAPASPGAGHLGGTALAVGVLTTSYPRHPGDYAGCFVEDRVNALLDAGADVHVIAAGAGDATMTRRIGAHLTVTRIPFSVGEVGATAAPALFYGDGGPEALEFGGAAVWTQAARFWGALTDTVRTHAPAWTAIEAHWLLPCALAALRLAPTLPLRAFAHSGDVALLERLPLGAALARWLAARGARAGADLIFVSGDLQARFAARAGRTVGRVQHQAPPAALFPRITPETRQAARDRLGLRRPTVISAGRLVPIKQFGTLVTACASLAVRNGVDPDLVILGDGPQRESLRAAATFHGVRLILPGWVPRPALRDWLHAADVFAQTSGRADRGRSEGMPVAALEALTVGLPVVATDAGGLRELAKIHALDVVPAGNPEALAGALARILCQEKVLEM